MPISIGAPLESDREIDFVSGNQDGRVYVQAGYLHPSRDTSDRELLRFALLVDACPRYLLTLDLYRPEDFESRRHLLIARFLTG